MKACRICGVLKDETKFRKHRRACHECEMTVQREKLADPEARTKATEQQRGYRRADPETYRGYVNKHHAKRRWLLNVLKTERGCYDCGGMFPPEILEWDHLPGQEKCFSIGTEQGSVTLEACIDEIEKCQVVCANCHRIRTTTRKKEKL